MAWAHTLPFWPEARYAATTSRQRCICSLSIFISSSWLIAKARCSQFQKETERWVGGTQPVLDPDNVSVELDTLMKAARAVGNTVEIGYRNLKKVAQV